MTRDGVVEVNETQQTAERISSREADSDFSQPDSAAAERVIEHLDAAHTRKANKKAVKKEQEATALRTSTSRLQFTDEERATLELERYIEKSNKAADRLDAAKAAIPKQKKLVKERTFDEATGKAKTRLRFEEQEKPIPGSKKGNPLSRPAQEAGIFVHNKIHSVEKDNSGVEGAHKSEELAERGAKYGARKLKQGYRSHKLKPYREAAKAEKAAFKANVNFQYHKTLHDNPQLTSNPLSRFMQKQQIKRQRRALGSHVMLEIAVCQQHPEAQKSVFRQGIAPHSSVSLREDFTPIWPRRPGSSPQWLPCHCGQWGC